MSVAFLSDVSLMHTWRKGIAEALATDAAEQDDPANTLIGRLAADGMWTFDLYGTYGLEGAQRKRILDKLFAMTRAEPIGITVKSTGGRAAFRRNSVY